MNQPKDEKDNLSGSSQRGNDGGGRQAGQEGSGPRSQGGRESEESGEGAGKGSGRGSDQHSNTGTRSGNPGNFTTDREHATDAGDKRDQASHSGHDRGANKGANDQGGGDR